MVISMAKNLKSFVHKIYLKLMQGESMQKIYKSRHCQK